MDERNFGPFEGKTWINCSHQGALPRVAVDAAQTAIGWKTAPHHLTSDRFTSVTTRLRETLARLVSATPDEIILANSASYGLHLIANGLPLGDGDEVLLVRGDFPSVILPWLGLERKGVRITFIDDALDADVLRSHMRETSRVLCTTWVHSFTGRALDLDALGRVCHENGVRFVVNGAQAVGARPIDVSSTPIDALVSVGFKWLCGPYGTGFCWMRPELMDELDVNQAYWLAMQTADDLGAEQALPKQRDDLGARRYDIFGTANFFNYVPWTASIDYLLETGIDAVAAHDAALVDRLIDGLGELGYLVLSPRRGSERSTIVITSHEDRSRNQAIHQRLKERNVEIAYRRGNLRFSPHIYNTREDVEHALETLGAVTREGAPRPSAT